MLNLYAALIIIYLSSFLLWLSLISSATKRKKQLAHTVVIVFLEMI